MAESPIARWSRMALATRRAATPSPQPRHPDRSDGERDLAGEASATPPAGRHGTPPSPGQTAEDPPALPPVESLGAQSDYRAFLDARVPQAVRTAALRRAWASDEAIAAFRGFADYDWDFNAPGAASPLGSAEAALIAGLVLGPPAGGDPTAAERAREPVLAHDPPAAAPPDAGLSDSARRG